MRRMRFVAVAVISAALVFSSVPMALAGHRGHLRGHRAPYRITKPSVAEKKVVMGVSFDATGVVVPAIAADDASTTVAINVFRMGVRGRRTPVLTAPATLSATIETGTAYTATLALPNAGEYQLVAVVSLDGAVIARSTPREMRAVLPYRISKPRVASRGAEAGVSFDATGVVMPAIAADDASTTVGVRVLRIGRHGRLTEVAIVDAVLTGAVGEGTGYAAAITLPDKGRYVLVARVMRDGVLLGRSGERAVKAYAPAPDPEPVPEPTPDPAPVLVQKAHRR